VGSAIDAVLLLVPTVRKTSARLVAQSAPPISVGLFAAAIGVAVGVALGETPVAGIVAAVAAFGTWASAIMVVRREHVSHLVGVARRAVASSLAPGGA
jgi:hypothetical protein